MGDLNAIASCVNNLDAATIKTTGTITTGAVTVFSGQNTLTSGNLSGDVTTSGGTVTALIPSGVSPGTYTNATVTVDAKGRVTSAATGTAGTGTAASFTATDYPSRFASTTLVQAGAGLLMTTVGATGSGVAFGFAVKPKPVTTSWQLQAKVGVLNSATNFEGAGLAIRDSASGNMVAIYMQANTYAAVPTNMTIRVDHINGSTNAVTNLVVESSDSLSKCLRIRSDGVNYYFEYSASGMAWRVFFQEPVAAYLTGGGNQIGFAQYPWYESGSARNAIAEIAAF